MLLPETVWTSVLSDATEVNNYLVTHSTASVCLGRLHGHVLDFIQRLAMSVAEISELNRSKEHTSELQ